MVALLSERYFHFGVAAWSGRVHDSGDAIKMQSYARPPRRTRQNYDGNLPAREVLLVSDSLVRGEQEINRRFLCHLQQSAVSKPVPTFCFGRDDGVAGKRTGKAPWRSVVKENEHRRARMPAQVLTP